MASYVGTFTLRLHATLDNGLVLSDSGSTPWTVTYHLNYDLGVIQAWSDYASGIVPVTVTGIDEPFNLIHTGFSLAAFHAQVPPDTEVLPFPVYIDEFGDQWTRSAVFSADRSRITFTGSASFEATV